MTGHSQPSIAGHAAVAQLAHVQEPELDHAVVASKPGSSRRDEAVVTSEQGADPASTPTTSDFRDEPGGVGQELWWKVWWCRFRLVPDPTRCRQRRVPACGVNVRLRSSMVALRPQHPSARTPAQDLAPANPMPRFSSPLDVSGHQVGGSRRVGGSPPSALWRRRVL
jgi:hypothetical protein